jgi:hypothetical protein
MMLRPAGSKTRNFCPSEAKVARFQASLSSPFGRGTMPAQPSNGFFTRWPSQRAFAAAGENERAPNFQPSPMLGSSCLESDDLVCLHCLQELKEDESSRLSRLLWKDSGGRPF